MSMELYNRMAAFGEPIGHPFAQHGRMETAACWGICLDWIRRALVGRKYSYDDQKESREHRLNLFEQNHALQSEVSRNYLEKMRAHAMNGFSQGLTPDQVRSMPAFSNLARSSAIEYGWRDLAAKLDENLKEDRRSRADDPWAAVTLSRPYSKLGIVGSTKRRIYKFGVREIIRQLLDDNRLEGSCAALLSIAPPLSDTVGHAVAILPQIVGKYYFFDPNFGTFWYDRKDLIEAVAYLFIEGYPQEAATRDGHEYQIDGKINGGYTIFEA